MNISSSNQKIEGTIRVEAFSDGVIAIIITLLVLEVRVPHLTELSTQAVFLALLAMAPKAFSFAVSFFTVAIFWVNHHHIFSQITHSNGALLWYNNLLLFWLAVVPFTTAFIGEYPNLPIVVSLYALALFLAALSFSLLGHYVFFRSGLLPKSFTLAERSREWKRGTLGFILYGVASVAAFVSVHLAHAILVVIPFLFVVPKLLGKTPSNDSPAVDVVSELPPINGKS